MYITNHLNSFNPSALLKSPQFQMLTLLALGAIQEGAAKSCYAPCYNESWSSCYIDCQKSDCSASDYSPAFQRADQTAFTSEDARWRQKACDSVYLIANEVLNKTLGSLNNGTTLLPSEQDDLYRTVCELMRGSCTFSCERSEFAIPSAASQLAAPRLLATAALLSLAHRSPKLTGIIALVFAVNEMAPFTQGLDVKCTRYCDSFINRYSNSCQEDCDSDDCEEVGEEDGERTGTDRAYEARLAHYERDWAPLANLSQSIINGTDIGRTLTTPLEIKPDRLRQIIEGAACAIYPIEGGDRPAVCAPYPPPDYSAASSLSMNGQLMLGATLLTTLFKRYFS